MLNSNKGITINDIQHPRAIFSLWTEAERNAIGIYEVTIDQSKKKDEKWYINTDITYAFSGGKVTGSYGDATAKAHADTLYTAEDDAYKIYNYWVEKERLGDAYLKAVILSRDKNKEKISENEKKMIGSAPPTVT